MLQRFKHIKTTKKRLADGTVNVQRYHCKTGRRIEGEPGTPEFAASYALASQHIYNGPVPGSLHALVMRYFQSQEFAQLAPRTQRDYRKQSDRLLEEFGSAPLAVLVDKRVRGDIAKWRDGIANSSPRQADYAVAFMSCVLSYGCDLGELAVNYAKGMGSVYSANRSDKLWEPEDIQAFLKHATPEMVLALRLALDTAQRQGDLIRLLWTQFRNGRVEIRLRKVGKPVSVPCTELLRAALENTPRRAMTILTGERGNPWTADGFRSQWYKASIAAGIQGRLTFNDLRGTAVTRLAEAGCTIPEIRSISGHTTSEISTILESYLARTNRQADRAIAKLDDFRKQNKS